MNITFAQPGYLALLLIVPFVILFAVRSRTRRRNHLRRFASSETSGRLNIEVHSLLRASKWVLICLVFALMALALAGPHYDERLEMVKLREVDVFYLLDVSNSMTAGDVPPAPTRLELAKRKIRALKDRLIGDRIGLIVFSNRAYTLCPLTIDENAFDFFLDDVDTDTISTGGTNISSAIRKAGESFDYRTKTERVIVLVSDGEEPEIRGDAVKAIKMASDRGIHVFVLGIGTVEGSHIDEIDPDTGRSVNTSLDLKKLRSIAEEGRGIYVDWSNSNRDVNRLVDGIEDVVESSVFETETRSREIEFSMLTILPYQIPLFAAIILLCMETFIKN